VSSPRLSRTPSNTAFIWWRRRESNPGPEALKQDIYVCSHQYFGLRLGTPDDRRSFVRASEFRRSGEALAEASPCDDDPDPYSGSSGGVVTPN